MSNPLPPLSTVWLVTRSRRRLLKICGGLVNAESFHMTEALMGCGKVGNNPDTSIGVMIERIKYPSDFSYIIISGNDVAASEVCRVFQDVTGYSLSRPKK